MRARTSDSYLSRNPFLGAHAPSPINDREAKRRAEARKAMRRLIATRTSAIYQEAS